MKYSFILAILILSGSCATAPKRNNLKDILKCVDSSVRPEYKAMIIEYEDYLISKNILSGKDKKSYLEFLSKDSVELERFATAYRNYGKERPRLAEIYQLLSCCRDIQVENRDTFCTKMISMYDDIKPDDNFMKLISEAFNFLSVEEFTSPYIRGVILFYSEMAVQKPYESKYKGAH